ncbi:hypothetical protein A2886_02350 [candidate division WWE3 bacterium RIFCSPHIGHO2_01_FULL_42_13]|uniref:Uncharacterized protein n=1 Tax=candidate division WWE3 bacterium RIFCSPHIGHO2_01_FULL_42_13 TaxID=1802617 RepID=A0A1F4URL4_UNCKA|nr:MAG: hypothetical protein A2886_02350 [candidate division WWE3 bacterium RIFCSPHIGHO2_01_FULL_42_13]
MATNRVERAGTVAQPRAAQWLQLLLAVAFLVGVVFLAYEFVFRTTGAGTSSNRKEQNPVVVVDEPTSTEVAPSPTPASTSTPEATATVTVTAVPEGVYEFPEVWAKENGFLELAKEVEPGVSWTTAACQFYEEEVCITDIDLCPEGNVCPPVYLMIWPLSELQDRVSQDEIDEFLATYPHVLLGESYLLRVVELDGTERPGDGNSIFLSPTQWHTYTCAYSNKLGDLRNGEFAAFIPITGRIDDRYLVDGWLNGLLLHQTGTKAECGGF